jgi:glycosyltransferase involved in cell wall biosynthesis
MKIVFTEDGIHAYASASSNAVGGAERQQWYLARALAMSGWNVVVGVRGGLKPGERPEIQGVEFVGLDARRQILRSWQALLSSERPDWWYWRTASHLYGPVAALARMSRVRTIFSAAFDRDVYPRRALSRRSRWWPLYASGLFLTDRILVQHSGQLSALSPRWRAKARLVRSIAAPDACAASHFQRDRYVAWVGMLRAPKRPDILVEIAERMGDVRFVVCGGPTGHRSPDGYGEQIAQTLSRMPNVTFLGRVPIARCQEIVANAALLLCTSDEEGFPNTFLEAWSGGTPVVSLTIDPDGFVERRRLGAVSSTVSNTVPVIRRLLDSPQERERIAARAREHVARYHSAGAVIAAFERAVNGRRSSNDRSEFSESDEGSCPAF